MCVFNVSALLEGESLSTVEWLLVAGPHAPVPVAIDIILHEEVFTSSGVVYSARTDSPLRERGIAPQTDETADGVVVELESDVYMVGERRL